MNGNHQRHESGAPQRKGGRETFQGTGVTRRKAPHPHPRAAARLRTSIPLLSSIFELGRAQAGRQPWAAMGGGHSGLSPEGRPLGVGAIREAAWAPPAAGGEAARAGAEAEAPGRC